MKFQRLSIMELSCGPAHIIAQIWYKEEVARMLCTVPSLGRMVMSVVSPRTRHWKIFRVADERIQIHPEGMLMRISSTSIAILIVVPVVIAIFGMPADAQQILSLSCHSDFLGYITPNIDLAASRVTVGWGPPPSTVQTGPYQASVTPLLIGWTDPDRGTFSIDRSTGNLHSEWKNGALVNFACTQIASPQPKF